MSQNWNPGQPPGPPAGGAPPPGGYGAPPPGGYGAPPPGGYGQPPGFGGPPQNFGMDPMMVPPQGNFGLGFVAGFFGGCIGLILVYAIAKGPQTKKGAGVGFATGIVIGAVIRIILAASR